MSVPQTNSKATSRSPRTSSAWSLNRGTPLPLRCSSTRSVLVPKRGPTAEHGLSKTWPRISCRNRRGPLRPPSYMGSRNVAHPALRMTSVKKRRQRGAQPRNKSQPLKVTTQHQGAFNRRTSSLVSPPPSPTVYSRSSCKPRT